MSDNNMRIWNKCKHVPAEFLKKIEAGRLKGKSDISPQWRMQIMTEIYGPCGIGWRYTIDKLWMEKGHGEEVFAFALISLYTKEESNWSDPIPGIGGHFLIEQESRGPHNNDEAFKMAVTDALSVAMKALGVAAEVYLGQIDSKYNKPALTPPQVSTTKPNSPSTSANSSNGETVILYIEDIEMKEGKNKAGKAWHSWTLKVGEGKWGTFSKTIGELAEKAKIEGKPVEVTYIQKEYKPGKFSNEIESLNILDDKVKEDDVPF